MATKAARKAAPEINFDSARQQRNLAMLDEGMSVW
jgi:hypothetical protein